MQNLKIGSGAHGSFLGSMGNYSCADAVIIGAPMDYTVSFRPGSRMGPGIIRKCHWFLKLIVRIWTVTWKMSPFSIMETWNLCLGTPKIAGNNI